MATSKAKRPILLAQPKPQHKRRSTTIKTNSDPAAVMPVKAHVYQAIGEMNSGFETVIQELHTLSQVGFLRPARVTAMRELVCRLRAEVQTRSHRSCSRDPARYPPDRAAHIRRRGA